MSGGNENATSELLEAAARLGHGEEFLAVGSNRAAEGLGPRAQGGVGGEAPSGALVVGVGDGSRDVLPWPKLAAAGAANLASGEGAHELGARAVGAAVLARGAAHGADVAAHGRGSGQSSATKGCGVSAALLEARITLLQTCITLTRHDWLPARTFFDDLPSTQRALANDEATDPLGVCAVGMALLAELPDHLQLTEGVLDEPGRRCVAAVLTLVYKYIAQSALYRPDALETVLRAFTFLWEVGYDEAAIHELHLRHWELEATLLVRLPIYRATTCCALACAEQELLRLEDAGRLDRATVLALRGVCFFVVGAALLDPASAVDEELGAALGAAARGCAVVSAAVACACAAEGRAAYASPYARRIDEGAARLVESARGAHAAPLRSGAYVRRGAPAACAVSARSLEGGAALLRARLAA